MPTRRQFLGAVVSALAAPSLARPRAVTPPVRTPGGAILAALADAQSIGPGVGPYTRYLWLGPIPAEERPAFVQTFSLHVNLLSRETDFVEPRQVAEDLLAVNILDYGWDADVYYLAKTLDPYFHVRLKRPSGEVLSDHAPWLPYEETRTLARLVDSRSPLLRADWFLANTCRQLSLNNKLTGFGYYDFLGLKSRGDFFRLIGLDPGKYEKAKDQIRGNNIRGAVEQGKSGVATHNRQFERLVSDNGGAWFTLDADDSTGKKNAVQLLRRGDFQHQAEEWYGVLPNGLPVTLLCDAQGVLQATAPDFIGIDDSPDVIGRDHRIHANLACLRCHKEDGLRPPREWVRENMRSAQAPGGKAGVGLSATDYKDYLALKRQFFSDLEKWFRQDRAVYAEAFLAATTVQAGCVVPKPLAGLGVAKAARQFARTYNAYAEHALELPQAAAECGLSSDEFRGRLKLYAAAKRRSPYPQIDNPLAPFLRMPPGDVGRLYFEEFYGVLMLALQGLDVPREYVGVGK